METRKENSLSDGERICVHPVYATLTTVAGVATGLVGSLYLDEIRYAFPIGCLWDCDPDFSFDALRFWILLGIFSALLFSRRHSIDKAAKISTNLLVAQSEDLATMIRTLPPKGFLDEFGRLSRTAYKVAVPILVNANLKDKERSAIAIRLVLDIIVDLARQFDGRPGTIVYSANVMTFVRTPKLEDAELEAIRARLHFARSDLDLRRVRGVLDLKTELSTTTATKEASKDKALRPFALPIYPDMEATTDDRRRVLPGAPFAAFVDVEKVSVFRDTKELAEWCRERGDFAESISREVSDYFRDSGQSGGRVKSFVSLALWLSSEDLGLDIGDEKRCVVVNIHRNKERIIVSDDEPLELFVAVMRPLIELVARLVAVWEMSEPKESIGSGKVDDPSAESLGSENPGVVDGGLEKEA